MELVNVHIDLVKASRGQQELERNLETLYLLISNTLNSLDSSTVHEFSSEIISKLLVKKATFVKTLMPVLLADIFPRSTPATYLQFSSTLKSIIWACQLEIFDFSEVLIQFCISYIKMDPLQYSPLFKVLSDLIGVNSEHSSIIKFTHGQFAQEFLKLGNILASQEENLEKFCDCLPHLLALLSTLLLFNPLQTLSKGEDYLLLTQNLAKLYHHFNNAEVKSSILSFWATCLSIEAAYSQKENLQSALILIVATPLACVANLPSMSLTHQITKIYTSALLRSSGRRQQLQTPREMEKERNLIEQGVKLGASQLTCLQESDKERVVKRLLGCNDVS